MNDQATKLVVFIGGAGLIYLFAKKMGWGKTNTGTSTTGGGTGSGLLIGQVGGSTSTGGTMGGTTGTTGISSGTPTTGGLNPGLSSDIYSTRPELYKP